MTTIADRFADRFADGLSAPSAAPVKSGGKLPLLPKPLGRAETALRMGLTVEELRGIKASLVEKALQGNLTAAQELIRWMQTPYFAPPPSPSPSPSPSSNPERAETPDGETPDLPEVTATVTAITAANKGGSGDGRGTVVGAVCGRRCPAVAESDTLGAPLDQRDCHRESEQPVFGPTPAPTPMSDATTSSESLIGQTLGTYRLLRQIGQGGMGAVFVGLHEGLLKEFAVKVLPKSLADSDEYVERFKREARRAAQLDHPNIVNVVDFGIERDCYYMAMALVEGQSLRQILKDRGALPLREAFSLFSQAVAGVAYAHSRDIIHRDIKPDNLLVNHDGVLKIVDFGLARRLDEDVEITRSAQVLGTPLYMPVEQWRGDPVDHRADIYSLGVTLYHMLCGQPPFHKGSAIEILRNRLEDNFAEPIAVRPELPRRVNDLILRMMAREPKWRHATIGEVEAELREIMRSLHDGPRHSPDLWSDTDGEPRRDPSGRAPIPTAKGSASHPLVDPFALWSEADAKAAELATDENRGRISSRRQAAAIPGLVTPNDASADDSDTHIAEAADENDDGPDDAGNGKIVAGAGAGVADRTQAQYPLPSAAKLAGARPAELPAGMATDIDGVAEKIEAAAKRKKAKKSRGKRPSMHHPPGTPPIAMGALDATDAAYVVPEKPPRKQLYGRFKILVPLAWVAIVIACVTWWTTPPPGWELQPLIGRLTAPSPAHTPPPIAPSDSPISTSGTSGTGTGNGQPSGSVPDSGTPHSGTDPQQQPPPETPETPVNGAQTPDAPVVDPDTLPPSRLPAMWAGGAVRGNAILVSGDYLIRHPIDIPPGSRLTLQAGSTLTMTATATLTVRGQLKGDGESARPIRLLGAQIDGRRQFPGIAVVGRHATIDLLHAQLIGGHGRAFTAEGSLLDAGPTSGGAILAVRARSVSLVNCQFSQCHAVGGLGGAVHLEHTPAMLSNVRFENNRAAIGGAISVRGNDQLNLRAIVAIDNQADDGGALAATEALIVARDCEFSSNTATRHGGAIFIERGRLGIVNSKFIGNRATLNGGGISATDAELGIDRTELRRNRAADGAGLAVGKMIGEVRLMRSTFAENQAARHGGALHANESKLRLVASVWSTNTATAQGGAIAVVGGTITADAPAGNDSTAAAVTFSANTARDGGAIFADGTMLDFSHVIFTTNRAAGFGGALAMRGDEAGLRGRGITALGNRAGQSGGAWHLSGVLMVLTDPPNEFRGNHSGQSGGAWHLESLRNGSSASETTFATNVAHDDRNPTDPTAVGGAICIRGGFLSLFRPLLKENTATHGGALDIANGATVNVELGTGTDNRVTGHGGAIRLTTHATATILGGRYENNRAGQSGGAIAISENAAGNVSNAELLRNQTPGHGGAISLTDNGELTIDACTITHNAADRGGAAFLAVSARAVTIQASTINHNAAQTYGGALFLATRPRNTTVRSNRFYHNEARTLGGAICLVRPNSAPTAQDLAVIAQSNTFGANLPDNLRPFSDD